MTNRAPFLALSAVLAVLHLANAADLIQPPVISSSGGLLDITLTLERATHSQDGFSITTRLFNGILPGPTIRISPGDVMRINFRNNLSDQGVPYRHNRLSAPDETNLHFHGLHISGELPSDDALLHLSPGQGYNYEIGVPADHMPGTHWLHPHRHGSTSLQVGGGAALTVIVEDPPSYPLPAQVRNAKEVVLVVMQIDTGDLLDAASSSNDRLLSLSGAPRNKFVLTNGQINPTIRVDPGEWVRMRVVFAGWLKGDLGMTINGCEMQLLSKDGIYIRDFPRPISSARIVPGGRADIMARCSGANQSYSMTGWGSTMGTIVTSGNTVSSSALQAWTPPFPSYLTDLRNTPATNGCSCSTNVGDNDGINNQRFQLNQIMHSSPLGAVIQRNVNADDHPYHQHVYPYQFVSVQETQYNKIGDWHDSILGTAVVRHKATRFAGKIMIHCHRLEHEDEGMMAMEYIDPNPNAPCTCGFRAVPQTIITNAPVVVAPVAPVAPVTPQPIAPTPVPAPTPSQKPSKPSSSNAGSVSSLASAIVCLSAVLSMTMF